MWICSAATASLRLESAIRSGSRPVIPTRRYTNDLSGRASSERIRFCIRRAGTDARSTRPRLYRLAGTAQVNENFFNANLFWMPLETPRYFDGCSDNPSRTSTANDFPGGGTGAEHAALYPNKSEGGFHYGPPRTGIWGEIGRLRSLRSRAGVALHRDQGLAVLCRRRMGRGIWPRR